MKTFELFALSNPILRSIKEMKFEEPTPVQSKAIPFILESARDMIALAQTGTGKTAAYGLPILENIDETEKIPQALILSPTRELAIQIARDLKNYAKYLKGIDIVAIYGGADIVKQMKEIKNGAQIIVATPGRMVDILRRKKIDISQIAVCVLDEADEMLHMGFKDDLDTILAETPFEKQTLLFSATMPAEVAEISLNYMTDPYEITVGKKNTGSANVIHHYYIVQNKDRYYALKSIADMNPDIYGIIFCRTRQETKDIADMLIADGYNTDALHGDLSQAQRDVVMKKFRMKQIQLLVATDVAARGLDVHDLTHVIHYNLPEDLDIYTHRSGRTGRAGKEGLSLVLISLREKSRIKRLEKVIGQKFKHKEIPDGEEICRIRLFHLVDQMAKVEVNHKQIAPFMNSIMTRLESFSKEEIIKKFVSLEFNHFLEYYKDSKNINVDPMSDSSESKTSRRKRRKKNPMRKPRETEKPYEFSSGNKRKNSRKKQRSKNPRSKF